MEGAASPPARARADKPLLAQMSALGLLVLLWLLVLTNVKLDPLPLFAFHPLLVSMGLYMLFQGMAALQKTQGQDEKARGLLRHKILLGILGVPLITVGVYIMWHLHSKPGAKHFISWHGILGALLLLALWLQGLFGLAVAYSPRMIFGSENRAKAMYKYHRLSGYVLGALILLELLLAIWEVKWVQRITHWPHRLLATGLAVALGWGVFRHVDAAKLGW